VNKIYLLLKLIISFFTTRRYAGTVFAVALCPSVCPSIRLSQVVFCQNG